jgi:hypothetical protein
MCRTARYAKGRRPGLHLSAAGDEGHHDVSGVLVEVLAAMVVDGRRAGIGVTGGHLDLSEGYARVEGAHDEGGPQHVRMDVAEPSTLGDRTHPAVGCPSVQSLAVTAQEDGAGTPLADGDVDRPRRPRDERDDGRLVTLLYDAQGPVAPLEAEVLDVGCARLADPEDIQPEENGQSGVRGVEPLGGEEEGAELGAVQSSSVGGWTLGRRTY